MPGQNEGLELVNSILEVVEVDLRDLGLSVGDLQAIGSSRVTTRGLFLSPQGMGELFDFAELGLTEEPAN